MESLEWIVQSVVFLVLLVISFFTFTAVGNLIAAPFNDILSEKTEQIIYGSSTEETFSVGLMLRDAARSLKDEIKKLSLFLAAMGVLFIINFIPFAGPLIFALCSILLTLYFLVIEYTGFVCSRKRIDFAQQRAFIRTHRAQALGFGVAVMLTLMLPLVQLFTIPLAVVGATHFCVANMDASLLRHPESQ